MPLSYRSPIVPRFAAAAILLTCMGIASPAHPQDTCSEALDSLAQARRARSILHDFQDYRSTRQVDLDRVFRLIDDHHERSDLTVHFELYSSLTRLRGYELCEADGTSMQAELTRGWTGVGLTMATVESDMQTHLFVLSGGDSIASANFDIETDPLAPSDEFVGYGTTFIGWSGRVKDEFSFSTGLMYDTFLAHDLGTDRDDAALAPTTRSQRRPEDANQRFHLGAGIPKYHLDANFIFGSNGDGPAYVVAGVESFPLELFSETLDGLHGTLVGGWIGDEKQPITRLGASYELWKALPYGDVAFEFNSPRMRHARLGAKLDLFDSVPLNFRIFETFVGAGVGARGEASIYNSGYLRDITGRDHVPGWLGGFWGSLVIRPVTITIEAFWARNRVATLQTLPDAAGKPEFGTKIGFRAGW